MFTRHVIYGDDTSSTMTEARVVAFEVEENEERFDVFTTLSEV